MAACMLHGACVGGGSRSTKLCTLRVKWLQPAMKGTSCVQRVRLRSFHARIGSSSVFCNKWLVLCAHSSTRFLNLRLQMALGWLHDCCHLVFMQGSADDTDPQGRSQDACKELCNFQLSIKEHVTQRTCLLKRVGVLSTSLNQRRW